MKLVIENLSKMYSNGVQALNEVSLTIEQGMFGLLGPNGAGKSTLMRILATLQTADSGTIMLGDIDVLAQQEVVRKFLGYLPQEFGLYPNISAARMLNHIAVLKGVTHKSERTDLVDSLLQRTNLWSSRNKDLGGFSGGMKQRFGIAQALLANPKLIIVDEPTAGLDPVERNRFLNLLSEIGEKTIVVLSTHIVEDVKELCTSMAIINLGQVIYQGEPEEAIEQLNGKVWKKRVARTDLADYKKKFFVISEHLIAGVPEIHVMSESQPDNSFDRVVVDLQDFYFSQIANTSNVRN